MIVLNDVGNWAFSSSASISSKSIQSSSIDSIESDDRLLNERKQLIDFGESRLADFGGEIVSERFTGNAGWANVNTFWLIFWLYPESIEL